jgi:glucose-1-phosphatase
MKTVFFDFGNVIGFFDHMRAVNRLLRFTDVPAPALFDALYGSDLELAYERGDITTDEYIRRAIAVGRLTCSPEEFRACFEDIFWPNPAVCDLVPKLKPRYRVGLASNTNDAHFTRYSAQFADTLRHFDTLCPSHFARSRKPDGAYFEYCQQHAEAEPGECVFVDDLPENIDAAHAHGWKGVLYRPDTDIVAALGAVGVVV